MVKSHHAVTFKILIMLNIDKDLNDHECTYIVGGNVKLYIHFVKQMGSFFKILDIHCHSTEQFYLHTNIYSSFILYSSKLETVQNSIHCGVDK